MNFDALFSAAQPVPIHAVLAIGAIVLGGIQFVLPKGTLLHRSVGYIWASSMFVVAISSFFINEFRWVGPFGPIHLLSLFVLHSLWSGIVCARRGRISEHKSTMIQLYVFGLIVAGAFTLMPGRIMHAVLLG